jgi:hypothetical protein
MLRTGHATGLLLACALVSFWPLHGTARAQDGIDGLRLVGRNDDEFAHVMDFHLIGDYAYASVGLGSGLQTYDVSDPSDPTRLNLQGSSAWRAYAHGDTIFSFNHASGVQMFDISSPVPSLLGSYNPPGGSVAYEDGVRVGDLLYVAAHQDGIHLLELTSPTAPGWISSVLLDDSACWSVAARGGHLFVANGRFGLAVIDVSGPAQVASLDLPGLSSDIVLAEGGAVAFLALASMGVAAIDISDPSNPELLDIAATLGNTFTIGLTGGILAAGSYPYAERFDASDPQNLVRAGWDATKVYAMGADAGVTAGGDTIIAVADWRGMSVYAPEDDPTGDIDIHPTRLDFGEVIADRDTLVQVRNTGAGQLTVTDIETPAGITADPTTFVLAPGETRDVTLAAAGSASTWSRVYYYSDDPDESVVRQYVYKNNSGFPQIGSLAPDFTLIGTDLQAHTLSDYRGRVVYLEFGANW